MSATTSATWTEHTLGLDLDSGDVGGDIQATNSASRRFVKKNDDGTYSMFTVYAYGTEEDDVLDVQEMVEYLTCREIDDGSPIGEIWSDYRYRHPFDLAPSSLDMAEVWAVNHVKSFNVSHISWDGMSEVDK